MSCGCRVFFGLIFVVVFCLFFNQPCVHKIAVNLILVQNCLCFIVLSVSFTVMLQSVYLFKEKVLIAGPFCSAWNGPSHSLHCPRQSRLCVSESLSLDDATYSRVQPWLHLSLFDCSANAWLFLPVHSLSRLRPGGVAENWVIHSANS